MPISLKCKLLLYADDSALLISGKEPNKIAEELSKELNSCKTWVSSTILVISRRHTVYDLGGTFY